MSEQPDTTWDKEYRRTTQECIDAAARVAGEPTRRVWPISGPDAKSLKFGRPIMAAERIPTIEIKETP